ncbi:unnamed protein product [Closterium sp. Yama58-4]|nr:unnamed protein product [Closterium sp. Yama58-4]
MPYVRYQAPPSAVALPPTIARPPTVARPATVKPARPATIKPAPTMSSSPTVAPSSTASPPTSVIMVTVSTPSSTRRAKWVEPTSESPSSAISPSSTAVVAPRIKQHKKSSFSARRRNAPAHFAPPPAALRSGAAMADFLMSYSRMLHLMPGGSRDLVAAGAGVLAHVLESLRTLLDTNQVKGVEAERLLFEVERDLGRLQFELAVAPEAFPVQAVRLQCAHAARVLRSV